ncbi:BRCT domain-containing protein [Trypanosoma rangeli]|uniref:BRCT domain-containing protein n=1 Tax=Trypanosoma rangeli TaxID=5698 RepID=A0A422NZK3_TRYRA|nr:BRCT domain-containing protein [Trypanosoma rangeli]RNF10865.1 BRCT domain-containing protein [Trypanosoma rangeli]|eukprot:RNF10865.1 BRCT domain-containing protein [Trypanosoma rangeli]
MCSVAATCEGLFSENTALRVECDAQEAEIAQLRHFIQLSVTKPDLYPSPQRVTLNKGLNVFPEKAWQQLNNATPHVDDAVVISALEEQLSNKNKQLNACLQEIAELKKCYKENTSGRTNTHDENTAHLLSQIDFLHNEVERLEQHVATVRADSTKVARSLAVEFNEKLDQKEKEGRAITEQFRTRKRRGTEGEDLVVRCKTLENQLAIALSEKNSLLIEKNEYCTKIRKLEATLKERRSEVSEVQKMASHESVATGIQIKSLQEVIQVLSDERSSLQQQLAQLYSALNVDKIQAETQTEKNLCDTSTQVDLLRVAEKECQVNSITCSTDGGTQSVQSLTHILELKCTECDELRARIDDLSSACRDALVTAETMKKSLAEEIERRKFLSDDAEKLSLQVRSLQQKCSQQAANERELQARINHVEEQKQQLRINAMSIERDKSGLEERLQQYQKDMEQLVANKNYSNQQVGQLASENERLLDEVQRLHQHEAQLAYSLKAKDGELREILSAYQNAVKEAESQVGAQRTIERELEATRATLASKEQRIIYLQEQLNQMHHRDQQLSLDLQTFEYENSQLHRRLVQVEALTTQLEGKCNELQQVSLAKDRTSEELQQSCAELSKQVVLKENECMLLRHRSESLQRDLARLQSVYETESHRLRELENANARLVVKGMISADSDDRSNPLRAELDDTKETLREKSVAFQNLQEQLRKEKDERIKCMQELDDAQASLEEALLSKERLQQVVLDQAATLSHLSQ